MQRKPVFATIDEMVAFGYILLLEGHTAAEASVAESATLFAVAIACLAAM